MTYLSCETSRFVTRSSMLTNASSPENLTAYRYMLVAEQQLAALRTEATKAVQAVGHGEMLEMVATQNIVNSTAQVYETVATALSHVSVPPAPLPQPAVRQK